VFINHACEFMDRGGITIGDDVLIGPKVNLVTITIRSTRALVAQPIARPSSSRRARGWARR